jgi:hypothetical protein
VKAVAAIFEGEPEDSQEEAKAIANAIQEMNKRLFP